MSSPTQKVPRCETNPATGIVSDTIQHYNLTQSEVAKAMSISPGLLSDIVNGKKGVSAEFAIRFEHCLGISAEWLLKTQAFYDYCTAYHNRPTPINKIVTPLRRSA